MKIQIRSAACGCAAIRLVDGKGNGLALEVEVCGHHILEAAEMLRDRTMASDQFEIDLGGEFEAEKGTLMSAAEDFLPDLEAIAAEPNDQASK